jgi:hypothetical protein
MRRDVLNRLAPAIGSLLVVTHLEFIGTDWVGNDKVFDMLKQDIPVPELKGDAGT